MLESTSRSSFDPVLLAVMANPITEIYRSRNDQYSFANRHAQVFVGMARDFSCSILTSQHEILAAGFESIPLHVFGDNVQGEYMVEYHPDLKEGDAFLANDPYTGNTHAADHTILVPVFVEESMSSRPSSRCIKRIVATVLQLPTLLQPEIFTRKEL